MQDIDNHMDELFQKAAANYPLKTNTGNFDDLKPFIAGAANTATPAVILKQKRKTALLLIAFFFMTVSVGTYFFTAYNNKTATNLITKNISAHEAASKNYTTIPSQNIIAGQADISKNAGPVDKTLNANTEQLSANIFEKNRTGYHTKGKLLTNILQPDAVSDDVSVKDNSNTVDNLEAIKTIETQNQLQPFTTKAKAEVKKEIKEKSVALNEPERLEKKTADKKNKNKPGFYYGIAAGVELNKVKAQEVTKATFNAAVILGLQINKKIAVETGVQLSQKKYYSDGKYFKPKSVAMPANMTVTSLQSTSTIIEIPVSVKYNFSKKKNTLYSKAGISTYIMTRESNKYQAVISGQQQVVNSTYKANKGYLASDVRISAGYQQSLNKKINLLIEPYIQIPVKGIGVGALPVTTAGLQIVLRRN